MVVAVLCDLWSNFSESVSASVTGQIDEYGYLIIDAGHGGFDPGAVASDGTEEKEINLAIACYLRDIAEAHGIKTVMLRESDTSLEQYSDENSGSAKAKDIHYRASAADDYPGCVYISIHQNAFSDTSQCGAQVFYGSADDRSELLAEQIMSSVKDTLQQDNRREVKGSNGSIYILDHVNCPMVLVECGFITNADELSRLSDPSYQLAMAEAIFNGYMNYINCR